MNPGTVFFHKRPLIGAAAGAVLGVLMGTLLRDFWIVLLAAALAAASGTFVVRKRIGWGLLLLLFAVLSLRTALVPRDDVAAGTYTVIGTVAEEPTMHKSKTTVVLRDVSLDGAPLKSRLLLSLPPVTLRYGDTIRVSAAVQPASRPSERAKDGVFAEGIAAGEPERLSHREDAYALLLGARRYFARVLENLYRDQAANAKAMLIGDRSDLGYTTVDQYATLGILHIFAISGLHVTALIALFGMLIQTGRRWLDLLLIMVVAGLYAALTSFTPSVLRAVFFVFLLRLADCIDRQPDAPAAFCFAAVAVLLFNPYSMYSLSFLLSFGAIAGLMLLTEPLKTLLLLPDGKFSDALVGAVAVVLAVTPIEAAFFGSVSWMTVPMAVLLAPALGLLLPLAFLSMLFAPFLPLLAKALAVIPYGAFVYIDRLSSWIHGSRLMLPAPHPLAIAAWYAGIVLVSPLFLPNRQRPPLIGLGLMIVALILWIVL